MIFPQPHVVRDSRFFFWGRCSISTSCCGVPLAAGH